MRLFAATLAFALFTTASALGQTYSCPGGGTPVVVPGYGTYCPATENAPEMHASSAVSGAGLLICTAVMLYPRRKRVR